MPDLSAGEAHHLPYGRVRDRNGQIVVGVRAGDQVIDLAAFTADTTLAGLFDGARLEPFLSAGRQVWAELRGALLAAVLSGGDARLERSLRPLAGAVELMPFEVADYVDFYASRNHASNVGRIFRPDGAPLTPNWEHLPIGYHGRAGTVVVSGTPIKRPCGQTRGDDGSVGFGPSTRLDIEAEIGFVVGVGTSMGERVRLADFRDHVFGLCLVNDWSARDIQAWEYVPLGPFLGKSFATSIAAWVTPLEALDAAWAAAPVRSQALQPYLDDAGTTGGLDISLTIEINGTVVSRPPFKGMYWTPAQMLAHMTVNGASLRTADLYASGTVSGERPEQCGSLLELSWNGERSVATADGGRTFLEDGDTVLLRASARSPAGAITLAEVAGRIRPADTSLSRL